MKLGLAGGHKNGLNTAANVLVDPFLINDVRGLLTLIAKTGHRDLPRATFEFLKDLRVIPSDLAYEDCTVQINQHLGKIRIVSKDYCPLAESDELWQEIERIITGGGLTVASINK